MDQVECFGLRLDVADDGYLISPAPSQTEFWPPVRLMPTPSGPKYLTRLPLGDRDSSHQTFTTPEEAVAVSLHMTSGTAELATLRSWLHQHPVCKVGQATYWSVGDFKIPQQSIRGPGPMLENPVLGKAAPQTGFQVSCLGYVANNLVVGFGQDDVSAIAAYLQDCRDFCLSEHTQCCIRFAGNLIELRRFAAQVSRIDRKDPAC